MTPKSKNRKQKKKKQSKKLKQPKILEKKNSRQRHTIGLTTTYEFSKKSSKTQQQLEFQTIFEKVTLEPL